MDITYYKKNRAKLDITNPIFSIIQERFSYVNKNKVFNKRGPDRFYLISNQGYIDTGLIWGIKEFLANENISEPINLSNLVKRCLVPTLDIPLIQVPNKAYKLRDYQEASIIQGFKLGRGIELIGTGGGKSLVIATMIESIHNWDKNHKILLVVPNLGLVQQMYDDFKTYKCTFTVGKWTGSNELDENNTVTIVNTGLLQRRFFTKNKAGKTITNKTEINKYDKFFKSINSLFYDEVHLFYGSENPQATILLKKYEYDHTFGFTGSMPNEEYATNKIKGFFGRIIYNKNSKELRDEKYLADVEIKIIKFNHLSQPDYVEGEPLTNLRIESEFISESKFRLQKTKQLVEKLNKNTLILVERIAQGEFLESVLKTINNKKIYFIQGSTDIEDRKKIIKIMEENNDVIVIAMSKIFSVGISINNLHYLIFYNLGKAWTKTIQSIGRGLRLHKSKNILIIFDFADNLVYSNKHVLERKEIYIHQQIKYKDTQIYEQKP